MKSNSRYCEGNNTTSHEANGGLKVSTGSLAKHIWMVRSAPLVVSTFN